MKLYKYLLVIAQLVIVSQVLAQDRQLCLYHTPDGALKQVNNIDSVPVEFQATAKCFTESRRAKNVKIDSAQKEVTQLESKSAIQSARELQPAASSAYLASPEEVKLKGTQRREDMSSAVGRIELRWPRKVETLFGRTPLRAMQDAASAVSRALKSSGFPAELQKLNLDWKVVFMDEELPDAQIPNYLISNCHPAWMTPPANLYIVAQRVVAGCNPDSQKVQTSVADSQLAHILIHEMGHAVEAQLLQEKFSQDRMRAEGFASWFEQYGSDFSTVINKGSIKEMYLNYARDSLKRDPLNFSFQGSVNDYARASLYFHALSNKRGVKGIVDVYHRMRQDNLTFFDAIQKVFAWNQKELAQEVLKVARKG